MAASEDDLALVRNGFSGSSFMCRRWTSRGPDRCLPRM